MIAHEPQFRVGSKEVYLSLEQLINLHGPNHIKDLAHVFQQHYFRWLSVAYCFTVTLNIRFISVYTLNEVKKLHCWIVVLRHDNI